MCLIEFLMLFEPVYGKKSIHNDEDGDEDVYEHNSEDLPANTFRLNDKTSSLMKVRNRPAVVRVPHFRETTDPHNFYYSLLMQHIPFRNENELLPDGLSPKETFRLKEKQLLETSKYLEIYRKRDAVLEDAFIALNAFEDVVNNSQTIYEESDIQQNADDEQMSDECFKSAQKAMNVCQSQLVNYIKNCIRQQQIAEDLDRNIDSIRLFVTGGAGTGKTFTLNLVKELICRCYSYQTAVKVGAPTGVSARLVHGSTLHGLFKLPLQIGKLAQLPMLTGQYLTHMRRGWKKTKFLIIDEISMVSYEVLMDIDARLRQIKNVQKPFGGINILFFGDLCQLPPVHGSLIFERPERFDLSIHLWRLFSLCELTENMRQRGDTIFIELLNRLREGNLTMEDFKLLTTKIISSNSKQSSEFAIGKALRIYPTNQLVNQHNQDALNFFKSMNITLFTIYAQDKILETDTCREKICKEDISNYISKDPNRTGGLKQELTLFVGARVMLRYNVDIQKGLVNGAMGFVTAIRWTGFRTEAHYAGEMPKLITIDFENIGLHNIEPISVQFDAFKRVGKAERRMLPVVLCYACTVHKMQGCTVKIAVVNLGSKLFAQGHAYVALSRVQSLDGVWLEELDCDLKVNILFVSNGC